MPIGYRMARLAMKKLGVEREKDHGFFVFPELGEGHPQTCLMDGLQVATGATYCKVMIAKTFYGKLAAVLFYHPAKGAVRFSLKPEFVDAMGKFPFFAFRPAIVHGYRVLRGGGVVNFGPVAGQLGPSFFYCIFRRRNLGFVAPSPKRLKFLIPKCVFFECASSPWSEASIPQIFQVEPGASP